MPRKVWIGIGLILIGAGLFGGWRWWMATRIWVPLEMPISLAKGHIQSPEFSTNFDGSYWIWIEVESAVDDDGVSCLTGFNYNSDYCAKKNAHELRATWSLSESQTVIAHGPTDRYPAYPYPTFRRDIETKARELGVFEVPAGRRYVLDVDIPEDYSRFDGGHPHLAIVTRDYWIFENWQVWVGLLSSILAAIGLALVLYPIVVWIQKKNDYQSISFTFPGPLPRRGIESGTKSVDSASLNPVGTRLSRWAWVVLVAVVGGICGYFDIPLQWIAALVMVGASLFVLGWAVRVAPRSKPITLGISPNHNQNIQWAQRLPLRPPISRMPAFGLIAGTIFAILAFWWMVLAPVTPKGLWVHLLKPGEAPTKPDAWTEPLIVRVKDDGVGRDPKLFVNSKQIAWDDLDRVLKQELGPRKDWVVYVSGDDAIAYVNVAKVIDVARSRGAKVIVFHDSHEQP